MTTYFTSDTHFGHARIQEFQADRPQGSIDVMNDWLVVNWNSVVQPDDTVWFLGDFAMGKIADSLPIAERLNGHKVIVAGNHDRFSPAYHHRNADKRSEWADKYRAVGFEVLHEGQTTYDLPGVGVVNVCHFPYASVVDHVDDREHQYDAFRPDDDGKPLIHGHMHSSPEERRRGRMIDVGVDAWYGFPVSEAHVAEALLGGE